MLAACCQHPRQGAAGLIGINSSKHSSRATKQSSQTQVHLEKQLDGWLVCWERPWRIGMLQARLLRVLTSHIPSAAAASNCNRSPATSPSPAVAEKLSAHAHPPALAPGAAEEAPGPSCRKSLMFPGAPVGIRYSLLNVAFHVSVLLSIRTERTT
jgi:hypothetical protein